MSPFRIDAKANEPQITPRKIALLAQLTLGLFGARCEQLPGWSLGATGEEKSGHDRRQDERSQTNDDKALANNAVGAFWVISVALLHSRFIGFDGRSRPHAEVGACRVLLLTHAAASIHCALQCCSVEAFRCLVRAQLRTMKAWRVLSAYCRLRPDPGRSCQGV